MLKRFFLNERHMMIAIGINALVIFLLYFPTLSEKPWLLGLDYFFVALFITEALVKIRSWGWKSYIRSSWNRFDFLIVILSAPTLISPFIAIPDVSVFLLLRLFRLIRLVKFVQFVPHINEILEGLGRALKASVFVLLALFALNFMLAILTCHFYGENVPQYFGNPALSAYSIFQLFTIEGWNEIPQVIADAYPDSPLASVIARVYIMLIVLFGGIFGMSLANAVFVDEMTMDNNKKVEKKIDLLQQELCELKELLTARQQKQ